jgi:hypothetical protein
MEGAIAAATAKRVCFGVAFTETSSSFGLQIIKIRWMEYYHLECKYKAKGSSCRGLKYIWEFGQTTFVVMFGLKPIGLATFPLLINTVCFTLDIKSSFNILG